MKIKRILFLLLPALAIVLEAIPYGAVLNFGNPEGEPFRRTFSYFDLTPYGYANFGPFLAALCTCALLICTLMHFLLKKRSLFTAAKWFSLFAFFTSLLPLFLGLDSFSLLGGVISLVLGANTLLLFLSKDSFFDL